MPSMALHSYFWADQGEPVVQGPWLTTMSRILGPPAMPLLFLMLEGIWKVLQ